MRNAKFALWVMLLAAFTSLQATQYHVVGELFTQTWCGYCPDAREGLAALYANQPDLFIPMFWEGDGQHPSPSYSARASMYGVNGIPHVQFGGTIDEVGGGTTMLPYYTQDFNSLVNYDAPIEMDAAFGVNGDGDFVISTNIEVTGAITTTSNKVVFIITKYWNDEYFSTVQRYAYIDFGLTQVGETGTYSYTFDGDASYDIADLKAVAMVQDYGGATGNKKILQAACTGYSQLTALFNANVTSGPAELGVSFNDMSIAPDGAASWAWDLDGDGNVDSSVQNPYYLYTEPGTYDVTLIVTDTNGETAATTLENYITVTDGSAVSGAVAGVWTQTYSPYNIIGTMTIEDGANLTIEPGVVVNVSNDALIEITGSITADASAGQAITIRGTEDRYSWQGIRIQYTDDVSLFDNVYIEDASDCALDIEDAPVQVLNCWFTGNMSTAKAAAVTLTSCDDVLLQGNMFTGNFSSSSAGAVGLVSSAIEMRNNIIVNNTGGFAAAIGAKQSSTLTMMNNTIANNLCTGSTHGHVAFFQSSGSLTNDIIITMDSNDSAVYNFGTEPVVTYCNVSGGFTGDGNIDADPLFTNPTEGPGIDYSDDTASWILLSGSPCVDAANPDAMYYDVEDPSNAGQAMYPARGTVTGDMGAFGGPNTNPWYSVVAVGDGELEPVVSACRLAAYPNPFNPVTTLALALPDGMKNRPVSLAIYNVRGERVATLLNNEVTTSATFTWHGTDDSGRAISSGVYFARLSAGGQVATCKLALLK